jgi:tRNA(Ile)-lysidine synthase
MLDKIAMILKKNSKVQENDLLLVGISGGPDSLCLLHLLHALSYRLIAAHVNHQLRPEADEEARMVQQFASDLGVESISTQEDVLSYAERSSVSIEEAARVMRYRYLFEQAEKRAAKAVVVGHNADDQAETILMHFLRGSGLSGLRGMDFRTVPNPWSDHIPLLRPLLSTRRDEIQDYLLVHHLNPITDQSNQDTKYFRNRLRFELLPILEDYNPKIRENLLRMAQIIRDDYQVLQNIVGQAWEQSLVKQGPCYLAFRLSEFINQPVSTQRYLLRKAINFLLPGLRDVGLKSIERGVNFLNSGKTSGQVDILGGVRIIKEGEIYWVASWQAELPNMEFPAIQLAQQLSLEIPSTICLPNGWNIQCSEALNLPKLIQNSVENFDPFQAWLAIDELKLPLTIRCRKAGDRIQSVGMQGHSVKLSDLMINLKIPKRARNTWPVVCSADEIVWMPGYRVSQQASVRQDSQQVINLILSRETAP